MLTTNHKAEAFHNIFSRLELTFSDTVSHEDHLEEIDLGSISILNKRTGHNWMLDVTKSLWENNTITAYLDDLKGTQEVFPQGEDDNVYSDYNLTIDDLVEDELEIIMYLGGESEVILTKSELIVEIPGETEKAFSVIIDS